MMYTVYTVHVCQHCTYSCLTLSSSGAVTWPDKLSEGGGSLA